MGSALTLLFVVCFNFFLFRIVPSDPLAHMLRGRNISREVQDNLRAAFGLDQPITTQFVYYLRETFRGNLGISFHSRQPVWDEIVERIPATVELLGVSWLFAAVIGTAGGVIAGWRRNTWKDRLITSSTMTLYSVPDFWLGIILLTVFSVVLGWFPIGGMQSVGVRLQGFEAFLDHLRHLFLPALTLSLAYMGEYTMVTRSSLVEVMSEDYLTVARAKGLRDKVVRNHHALPNALLPVVTLAALNLGFILSGAIAVESVFSWPGLGQATAEAIRGPDYPMLQGLFLLFSASVILFNLIADLLYMYLDPRVEAS
ncbi:MAG: ABC transporter permease [Actinomycetes bacterium]